MRGNYLRTLMTPSVARAQEESYGRANILPDGADRRQGLGLSEQTFISERDSFYLSSVGETGWPYVQHRGGEKGFLKVLDGKTLAFADLAGNRQLISAGNINTENRVSMILMDYVARERLKLIGKATVLALGERPEWEELLGLEGMGSRVQRLIVIEVVGFDWNCPKYITSRYTREEVEQLVDPMRKRIEELETLLAKGSNAD